MWLRGDQPLIKHINDDPTDNHNADSTVTSQNRLSTIRNYVRSIADTHATGHATEHSYRPALQTLIQTLGGDGMKALNEPSHVECGAPDFIV